MKIVLQATKSELIQLLCKATNSAITDYVVLKSKTDADGILITILVKMAQVMNCALVCPNTPCHPSQKIAYIKALREAVSTPGQNIMGLAEAKAAAENWVPFCTFVRDNGRLPKFNFDGGWSSVPSFS